MPCPLSRIAAVSAVLFVASGGVARADRLDLGSQADAEIVVMVAMAERVKANCAAFLGMDDATRAAYDGWVEVNHVDRVRAEMARLAADPATSRIMETVNSQVAAEIAGTEWSGCTILRNLMAAPAASFAARAAELPAQASAAATTSPPAAPATNSSDLRALAEQIEGFAFDSRAGVGWGGMVTLEIYPVVLFKRGAALTGVEGLGFAGGVDAHRRAHPDDWTQWRRASGEVQTLKDGAWSNLPFSTLYAKVPEGFALSGRYQRTGGTGNVALGGTDSVTTWETYDFWSGGQVVKGGGGAYAEGGDWATTSASIGPDRRGNYRTDGLMLTITYEDGATESAILVTDPNDPKVIWLNGRDFIRQDGE